MADRQRQGVQSVEIGAAVLAALAQSGRALSLKEIAAQTGLAAAKAHRYLVSLGRAGLVEQIGGEGGRYDLGEQALRVGLAALGRLDSQRLAQDALITLGRAVDQTALLAVWNGSGAAITRWVESSRPVTVNVREGSVMSPLLSASGRVFAAYRRDGEMRAVIQDGFERGLQPTHMGQKLDPAGFTQLLDDICQAGMARVSGDTLAGVDALAAPVFDHHGSVVMVMAVLGPHSMLDIDWHGEPARVLRETSRGLSRRLGWQG